MPETPAARFRRWRGYEQLPEIGARLHFVAFACPMLRRAVLPSEERIYNTLYAFSRCRETYRIRPATSIS